MKQLMLYCRSGFEKECAGEIQDRATQLEVFGFPRVKKNSGYVIFECYQEGDAQRLVKELDFKSLIFARQIFAVAAEIQELPREDRISPILHDLSYVETMPRCGDSRVETPDTNEAKELLKFCRKFTVPMRQALRGKGILFPKDSPKKPVLHICFVAPYGFVGGFRGASSVMGTVSGSPYTVAELLNINILVLFSCIASRTDSKPSILLR